MHDTYQAQPYQAYLLVVALALCGCFINTYLAKHLPTLEGIGLFIMILAFIGIQIVLWVLSPRLMASEVFSTFSNEGGWSSLGLSMMAGQILLVWSLTGQSFSCIYSPVDSHTECAM